MELSSSDDADGDGGSGTGALENTQPQQPRVAHAGRMNNEWCRLCLVKSIVFIRYNRPLHLNNRIYMRLATEPFVASLRFFPGGFSQPRARAPCRRLSGAKESTGNK